MLRYFPLLLISTIACATAPIIIKFSDTHPILVAAGRCILAGLILLPLYRRECRRFPNCRPRTHWRAALLPGVLLGLHFIFWIIGARLTYAANASLVVNMTPVLMPVLLWFIYRQRLTRREWLGTALALAGVLLLAGHDLRFNAENFRGDLFCLAALVLLAAYLILARINAHLPSIWLYVVPLYIVAGLFCLIVSTAFTTPWRTYDPRELAVVAALALIPTILGHSGVNLSMQRLPSQVVAIATSSQFIFAGTLGWLIFRETLDWVFAPAALLGLAGVLTAFWPAGRPARSSRTVR